MYLYKFILINNPLRNHLNPMPLIAITHYTIFGKLILQLRLKKDQ